jgi:hypothetical protein
MTDSPNLALPFIEGGELLPDVTLNEALRLMDTLVQLAVGDRDLNAPPSSPVEGQRWIVKASPSPTGAWAGHGNHVAAWQDGGWTFSVPKAGWLAFVVDEGVLIAWSGTAWAAALDVMGGITTLQNLSLLGVGTTADSSNPLSAKLNNALWTARTVAEGGDGNLRYKMSKESAAKTLSLLLQTNFSGRAEVGLTGDDNLHVKVSADGSTWLDAVTIDKSTAKLTLGAGFADQASTRAQVAAAPFDALAFNGMQVNGSMDVSQEKGTAGVTITASGAFVSTYALDSWAIVSRGSFVATATQVADAPAGLTNSLKVTIGTAESSLGSNDQLVITQPIEAWRVNRLMMGNASAQPVSIGFWVKAHRTGTYSASIKNVSIGSASPRSYPFSFTVNVADTWEFKTVTIPGDTSGSWVTSGAAGGLWLNIAMAVGAGRVGTANAWAAADFDGVTGTTNGVAATSDTFQITGVIALPGIELPSSSRAPLIMRPFDQELLLCRRYWLKNYLYTDAPGTAGASGYAAFQANGTGGEQAGSYSWGGAMRTIPTVTFYSANSGASGKLYDAIATADEASSGPNSVNEMGFSGSNGTRVANHIYRFFFKADARL